jgi:hypothetical protein
VFDMTSRNLQWPTILQDVRSETSRTELDQSSGEL